MHSGAVALRAFGDTTGSREPSLTLPNQCDPSTELEAPGLIPGTRLRPADVLTGALGPGLTAIDVGIASPDAAHAGDDCTGTMYNPKLEYYSPHAAAIERQSVLYQPLIWSAYGRPHPQSTVILRTLAKKLARRRGCSDAEWRYKRLRPAVARKSGAAQPGWCGLAVRAPRRRTSCDLGLVIRGSD